MSKRWTAITVVCIAGALGLSAVIAVPIRQRHALSHAKTRADVESLFGMPKNTFSNVQEIKSHFGARWDFYNLANAEASSTDQLPPVVGQACLFEWAIFEYLAYFEGEYVTLIFEVGTN
jgi:hypothetical protein